MSGKTDKGAMARRRFLTDLARASGGATLFVLGGFLHSRPAASLPVDVPRPPGAIPEKAFLGACVRCGLCVRRCPFDTLSLALHQDGVAVGTPIFRARQVPCEMCEDIPCVKACPTGALDQSLTDIDDADMGLAVLIDRDACLNTQGLRCDVCYRVCPAINKAITLETEHNQRSQKHAIFIPTVHQDHCTGCGKCEQACVLDEAAIKVLPRNLALGKSGEHYRLGWIEKQKSGGSLVSPDPKHEYNLPAGQSYEHGGRGLIFGDDKTSQDAVLRTLNDGAFK